MLRGGVNGNVSQGPATELLDSAFFHSIWVATTIIILGKLAADPVLSDRARRNTQSEPEGLLTPNASVPNME